MLRTKRAVLAVGTVFAMLALVISAQTFLYGSVSHPTAPPVAAPQIDGAAERLAGAIRIASVSTEEADGFDAAAFQALHEYLRRSFPLVHSTLRRETVGRYSLLYTWPGRNPSLAPVLLAGHLDVVPIEPGTEDHWRYPPFGGVVGEGFVWGRGAIDNKSTVMGTLESVQLLLSDGFVPERTVYLAFGHDEEVGGTAGAKAIAALLRQRGVQLSVVLDEGGVITEGMFPGVARPVALVGITEKGFATIELTATVPGGHSSLPPRETAVGILSGAVARLEKHQMQPRFEGATRMLFDKIGPELPLFQRVVFANLWLTRPLVVRTLERTATTNAMIRTTTAPTILQAGTKDNVLPSHARALLNFRILPGDSIAAVLAHVADVVDDNRVAVRVAGRFRSEPSAVSDTDSDAFAALERAVGRTAPDVVVAPYLVVVVTDARHYADLSRTTLRFLPVRLRPEDLPRMHGTNERIGIAEYATAIHVYREVLVEWAGHASIENSEL